MSSLRPILLAEDNPNDVELTLSALHSLNLANEIVVVGDGAQALDFLFRRQRFADRPDLPPAVVLLDLKMPRVDGLEALREIRAAPALAAVPVVILTSSREEADLVRGYELGANAYVVKPVDFEEFISAISQLGVFWALINEPPPATRVPPDLEFAAPFRFSSCSTSMTRILIIDDDEMLRGVLAKSLVHAGYFVIQAPDGQQGVELARVAELDLVITDLIMPVQEGVETIIKLHRERPGLPIIAMSGGASNSKLYLEIAEKIGARRILAKPFTPKQLLALIAEVLAEEDAKK